ncbi:hypothetical protein DFH09DRAFT_1466109 [Mycena vulgaris]|nr:hypothetical protein DFH09DRAFT_1466109 [Mycena vulgaris]
MIMTNRSFSCSRVVKELEGDLARVSLLGNFHLHTFTPGFSFTDSGPAEKDRQLYPVVIDELLHLSAAYRAASVSITAKMGVGIAGFAVRAASSASNSSPPSTYPHYGLAAHLRRLGKGVARPRGAARWGCCCRRRRLRATSVRTSRSAGTSDRARPGCGVWEDGEPPLRHPLATLGNVKIRKKEGGGCGGGVVEAGCWGHAWWRRCGDEGEAAWMRRRGVAGRRGSTRLGAAALLRCRRDVVTAGRLRRGVETQCRCICGGLETSLRLHIEESLVLLAAAAAPLQIRFELSFLTS